jgi:hypothetical protein
VYGGHFREVRHFRGQNSKNLASIGGENNVSFVGDRQLADSEFDEPLQLLVRRRSAAVAWSPALRLP